MFCFVFVLFCFCYICSVTKCSLLYRSVCVIQYRSLNKNPLITAIAALSAHVWTFPQQVNSTMAARGHVQDPNDRRLRPIYGKDLMESCAFMRI